MVLQLYFLLLCFTFCVVDPPPSRVLFLLFILVFHSENSFLLLLLWPGSLVVPLQRQVIIGWDSSIIWRLTLLLHFSRLIVFAPPSWGLWWLVTEGWDVSDISVSKGWADDWTNKKEVIIIRRHGLKQCIKFMCDRMVGRFTFEVIKDDPAGKIIMRTCNLCRTLWMQADIHSASCQIIASSSVYSMAGEQK